MAKLTIGLAGCGTWGLKILRHLVAMDVRVLGVDSSVEAQERALAAGAELVKATDDAWVEADAYVVATPATTHYAVIRDLLELEGSIFCEKPFTVDGAHAEELARRGAGRIFLGHIWRFHPAIGALRDIAQSGELGRIHGVRTVRANWTSPRRDTDALWTLAPHDLTIGWEILSQRLSPQACRFEWRGERVVGVDAWLGDEPWLTFQVSNRYADKRREVRVHGERGVAVWPGMEADRIEIYHDVADDATTGPELREVDFPPHEPLREELREFVDFVRGEGPAPRCSVLEGLAVVQDLERLRDLAERADGGGT